MKTKTIFIMLLLVTLLLAGCGGNDTPPGPGPKPGPQALITEPVDLSGIDTEKMTLAQHYKLDPVYVYSRALEGAAGCIRAA